MVYRFDLSSKAYGCGIDIAEKLVAQRNIGTHQTFEFARRDFRITKFGHEAEQRHAACGDLGARDDLRLTEEITLKIVEAGFFAEIIFLARFDFLGEQFCLSHRRHLALQRIAFHLPKIDFDEIAVRKKRSRLLVESEVIQSETIALIVMVPHGRHQFRCWNRILQDFEHHSVVG